MMRIFLILLAVLILAETAYAQVVLGEEASPAPYSAYNLTTFWRSDCSACKIEMDNVFWIARSHPELHIDIITFEDDPHHLQFSAVLPPNLHMAMMKDSLEIIKKYGDEGSLLPFSVLQSKEVAVCTTHHIMNSAFMNQWLETCSHKTPK